MPADLDNADLGTPVPITAALDTSASLITMDFELARGLFKLVPGAFPMHLASTVDAAYLGFGAEGLPPYVDTPEAVSVADSHYIPYDSSPTIELLFFRWY